MTWETALGPRADVSDREQGARAVDAIVGEHGPIDVLVNNAGISNRNVVLVNNAGISNRNVSATTPLEEADRLWDELSRLNVKGVLLMTLACAPPLARPGGRVLQADGGRLPG